MRGTSWLTVEEAVLTALREQLGSLVSTVRSYQGDWRAALGQEPWRLPAALVRVQGSRAEPVGLASSDLTFEVQVLLIVRELRGEEAARRQEGGMYELLQGVRQALWHRDLGLDLTPFMLVREEALRADQEWAVFSARYRASGVVDH